MTVEKTKLFELARARWPSTFRVVAANGVPSFNTEPSLVEIHREIEASCEPLGRRTAEDEWTGLAIWAFHQALWKLAEQSISRGSIGRDEVTFEMFDERMRFNLADDCWSEEREEYEQSPTRFH